MFSTLVLFSVSLYVVNDKNNVLYTATCTQSNAQRKLFDQILDNPDMMPIVRKIIGELEDPISIEVLIIGEVGVGKSTLVNGLVGTNLTKTGDSVSAVTKVVDKIKMIKNGIEINIIDTPGLGDLDLEDEDTLQNAIEKGGKIDLFLFCLKITDRLDRQAIEEMKTISDVLGEDIWKRAVFVLTFANEYNRPEKEKLFSKKLNEWETALKKEINKKKIIAPEIAEKIPIVPAGYKEPHLPNRPSWISEFWIQGFRRMGFMAMVKLVIINQERIQSSANNMEDMYGNPGDQPLLTCYMTTEKRTGWVNPEQYRAASQVVGTYVGAVVTMIPGAELILNTGKSWGASIAHLALNWLGIGDENPNEKFNCFDEAIMKSLIATFMEEYPEYSFEPPKDEL